jgi:hypothetical protein
VSKRFCRVVEDTRREHLLMLGPADLEDWTYDERDLVSGWLRRQDVVHALVIGRDVAASAFPPGVRDIARRFACHEELPLEDLWRLAEVVGAPAA